MRLLVRLATRTKRSRPLRPHLVRDETDTGRRDEEPTPRYSESGSGLLLEDSPSVTTDVSLLTSSTPTTVSASGQIIPTTTERMSYLFAVVTKVATGRDVWQNLATELDLYRSTGPGPEEVEPLVPLVALELLRPVFHVGEILILDSSHGREVDYPGRKPSKWGVETEEFEDLDDAVRRGHEVFEELLRQGAAQDDGD